MTAHSISVLSELKMSSFELYAGAKMRSLSVELHADEGRAKCPTVPQRRELVTDTRPAKQGSK